MTNKIPQQASALAQRIKMGRGRLWLIVEGTVHDRSFYDRVLRTCKGLSEDNYTIRLAQEFSIDGVAAGGKSHVLSLHRYFATRDRLVQRNKEGAKVIAFALDADYDRLTKSTVDDPHIVYTEGMDVEADIILHGNVPQAASDAWSLPLGVVQRTVPNGLVLAQQLEELWSEWVLFNLQSAMCGVGTPVAHAGTSRMNVATYGETDEELVKHLRVPLEAAAVAAGMEQRLTDAAIALAAHREEGKAWQLVKGKWLAKYVAHLVETRLASVPKERIRHDVVTKTCLSGLDFKASWANHYRETLEALLEEAENYRAAS